MKIFKIGSGECNNLPLIKHICKFKKPMIVSTGMNNLNTVNKVYKILKKKKYLMPSYIALTFIQQIINKPD